MGGGNGGGGSSQDAKHVLDSIGEKVYKEIVGKKPDGTAEKYKDELKGKLSQASILGERTAFSDTCNLVKEYYEHFNGDAGGKSQPCRKEDVNRFSDKEAAECANNRIEGNNKASNGKDVGACAPFRRLSLCKKNMEKIPTSTTKHDLLAEVCLAAKYEGASITRDYPQYQQKYVNSGSTMCTMLARSFADIGDIIRGRDLYFGKRKKKNQKETETERDKLEENFKKYFQQIHEDVTRGSNWQALQARYEGDKNNNFFQLREDWWTANRHTVWEAITCDKKLSNASYFRPTCGDSDSPSQAHDKCRCPKTSGGKDGDVNIVPTYFDYVPQFLRWFEEWAEDFCRKKKKYVDIVKTYCRGQDKDGNKRYCSRNGFDCEKTKRAVGKYRMGKQCISCLYACNPYVEWIDNQRKQFEKQKNKYDEEITRGGSRSVGRTKRGTTTTNYDGYEKIFYKKLEGEYRTVDAFLGLLNNEKACKEVQDSEGGTINFKTVKSSSASGVVGGGSASASDTSGTNVESQGTFYRSKYCQPCPHCGVKHNGNEWKEKKKDTDQCKKHII